MKRIYRMKELCQTYGLSRSTIYRLIEAGRFPKPIKISAKAVGWISTDLDEWVASRGQIGISHQHITHQKPACLLA